MRILVTGGTGVVGGASIAALRAAGHEVRLVSRHAGRDVEQWPDSVEPWDGDVADAGSLAGAADGCDAVLHLAGIVDEDPPDVTFESVNVEGTRHVVDEAVRAGVPRFVHVSSLGADRGRSPYHRSKLAAEDIVRAAPLRWTVVRPGNVFGGGDGEVSLVLRMVRTLPVVPLLGDGAQPFQPIWHEDLGRALAAAIGREDLDGRVLDVAGRELTTQADLVRRFAELTRRSPLLVPLPEALARLGLGASEALGVDAPLNASQLTMVAEGSLLEGENGLDVLGVEPTPLEDALARLVDEQPERLPSRGVGATRRKSYRGVILAVEPDDAFATLCERFGDVMPLEAQAEPGTPRALEAGATMTLELPLRGHVQVRCEELDRAARRATLVTLAGHPLTGSVTLACDEHAAGAAVTIETVTRPATVVDLVAMRTLGALVQDVSWRATLHRLAEACGSRLEGPVATDSRTLGRDEARAATEAMRDTVLARRRDAAAEGA